MSEFELTPGTEIFGNARFLDRSIRFEIRRWWVAEPRRWAAWLMLNPSYASGDKNDLTALRVTHFTRSWGFDGWIGVNAYPLVTSDPNEVWPWARWEENGPDYWARDAQHENIEAIERAGREAALRVVAFGAELKKRDEVWLEQCLEAFGQPQNAGIAEPIAEFYSLGTNASGQPLHPLARGRMRVPDSPKPVRWSRCS